jgi:hypothetical protein
MRPVGPGFVVAEPYLLADGVFFAETITDECSVDDDYMMGGIDVILGEKSSAKQA